MASPEQHILFTNATLITFNPSTGSLETLRNHSLLTTNSTITTIAPSIDVPDPQHTEIVDATDKILAPGFINTHAHMWQTAFRTLVPNVTLCDYFARLSQYSPAATGLFGTEEVFVSAVVGYLEGLNAGTTTCVEHAHANWGLDVMEASYDAAVESGGRVWWCAAFEEKEGRSVEEERGLLGKIRDRIAGYGDALVRLGYAWDGFSNIAGDETKVDREKEVIKELNAEAITLHYLGGPWKLGGNEPSLAESAPATLQDLNIPVIFSHGPFVTEESIAALRAHNWNLSITPESEMHYGHGQKTSRRVLDQASLGIDTPSTFSGDMLTQARLHLQHVRATEYERVLESGKAPRRSPMSVEEAFLLLTRQGGLAVRREDLGVLQVGAKADIIVFDTSSPNLVGSQDAVAAVMLHANVGDVESVLVDGEWRKREGKLVGVDWPALKARFGRTATKVQEGLKELDKQVSDQEQNESQGALGGLMEWGHPQMFSTKRGTGAA